jgi:hypothetical protein
MTRYDKELDCFFNSDWYAEKYPDVEELIAQDKFNSALEHYLKIGTTEKRSPNSLFDESYYLEANEDVVEAIAEGEFKCGYHHYLMHGESESRPPRQETQEEIDGKNALIEIFNETRDLNFLK